MNQAAKENMPKEIKLLVISDCCHYFNYVHNTIDGSTNAQYSPVFLTSRRRD